MDNPDLSHQWLPFTANRAFAADPRLLVSAEGVYYRDAGGRQLLDSVSGLFCVPAGHGRPEIASAVSEQIRRLDFAPPFQFAHPDGFVLAGELSELLPPGLDRVFFVTPAPKPWRQRSRGRSPITAPVAMPGGHVSSAGSVPTTGSISGGFRSAAWCATARRSGRDYPG